MPQRDQRSVPWETEFQYPSVSRHPLMGILCFDWRGIGTRSPRKLSVGLLRHFNPRLVDIRRVGIAVGPLLLAVDSRSLWIFGTQASFTPQYFSESGQLTLGTPTLSLRRRLLQFKWV